MAQERPKVFVSIGKAYTDKQVAFRDALLAKLEAHEMEVRMFGKNEFGGEDPLPHIRQVIDNCAGTIVVAFERKFVETGTEMRASPKQIKLDNSTYTTPWNHIESAMAYGLDKPLFVVCERGLAREGLINTNVGLSFNEVEIDADRLNDPVFSGRLNAWRERVLTHRPRSLDLDAILTLRPLEIAGRLSLASWAVVVAAITSILGIGFFFGLLYENLVQGHPVTPTSAHVGAPDDSGH